MSMALDKPILRTVRPMLSGEYACQYVQHVAYADQPSNYVRGFMLIQSDIMKLFEYVEPGEKNLETYSFRILELLLRTCTEFEANCKAILRANGYSSKPERDWNIQDYHKIEQSHFLSQYEVRMPNWTGAGPVRQPFINWSTNHELEWYKAYNHVKHDRASKLQEANLEHLVDAFCGLSALLAAQYWIYSFTSNDLALTMDTADEFEGGVGGYLLIKLPRSIPDGERYDFTWSDLEPQTDPFAKFDYDSI